MSFKSIAVDGPSGAGKSTLAKMLAEALGYLYVDTGAVYRTLGLFAYQNGVEPTDAAAVTAILDRARIELRHGDDGYQHTYLDGADVSHDIRRPEISKYASAVSAIPEVRAFLLDMQRDLARTHNVIMDGRDIGTVVLPDAAVKIFLTASAEERARRRHKELLERGHDTDFETVLHDIEKRDHDDSTRSAAPLKQAEDAILVDTTGISLEESLQVLLQTIGGKLDS